MSHPSYGLTRELPGTTWDAAVERTVAALKTEGFGVLTRIDVHDVMKAKLDLVVAKYAILGACNPTLAHRALGVDPWVGLLLPCNVVVADTDTGAVVSIVSPRAMFSVVENPAIGPVVEDVGQRLARVLERI